MRRTIGIMVSAAVLMAGCGPMNGAPQPAQPPASVRLLSMTTLEPDAEGQKMQLRAYVQPEKGAPASWYRFELYEFMPLDANPRGKRLVLWPQIEPGKAVADNPNWRPHLGAFEFILPVEQKLTAHKIYLAEVTALGPDSLRKSDAIKVTFRQP